MKDVLKVKNLVKKYGDFEAVKDISFNIRENEIFALIGPNGAGKTTTLRVISTILQLSGGEISINDIDVEKKPEKIREIISYLPEEAGAYKNMTGISYLKFMAEIFIDNKEECQKAIDTACELTGLEDRLKDKISSYSKGMTRKLLLAKTIMTTPKLAIMDEPTSGLDVLNAIEIRKNIRSFSSRGMAVLLSSHNMLEIEYLSDRVAIMNHGKIHVVGTPEELKKKYEKNNLEEVFAEVVK